MKKWLLNKWDWFVYRHTYNSLNRLFKSHAGFCYLLKLHVDKWNNEYPISDSLKHSIETFFEALESEAK